MTLFQKKKSRPSRGTVTATAISMPIAATSIVWWIVMHRPKKNIAV